MLSQFVKFKEIEPNIYAVFNALIMKVLFADEDMVNRIKSGDVDASVCQSLQELGIYVDAVASDDAAFARLKSLVESNSGCVSMMYLVVTTNCNLACKYCFVENNLSANKKSKMMDLHVAQVAVDKFIAEIERNNEGVGEIILFGGEPLLNPDFDKIVCYIREKSDKIKLSVVTNGTLLDKQMCSLLKENDVGIGISLDGPKNINDKNRVFKSGTASVYDSVINKIQLLNEQKNGFSVSATVTKDVLAQKEEVLRWAFDSMAKHFYWNVFHYSTYEKEWEEFYNEMSEFLIKTYDRLNERDISEGKINDYLRTFVDDRFRFQNCGAIGLNQIAVLPDGDVCVCHGDCRVKEGVIGNILTDEIQNCTQNPKASYWKNLYTVCHDECKNCEALFICGGGCPLQSEALFGDRKILDKATCIFVKKLLTFMLRKYYYAALSEEV